jgi:hypothetical protein
VPAEHACTQRMLLLARQQHKTHSTRPQRTEDFSAAGAVACYDTRPHARSYAVDTMLGKPSVASTEHCTLARAQSDNLCLQLWQPVVQIQNNNKFAPCDLLATMQNSTTCYASTCQASNKCQLIALISNPASSLP